LFSSPYLCDRIVEDVIAILGFPFFVFKKYTSFAGYVSVQPTDVSRASHTFPDIFADINQTWGFLDRFL
jgi:hypothetical protein